VALCIRRPGLQMAYILAAISAPTFGMDCQIEREL
jgi:hypothetical protein